MRRTTLALAAALAFSLIAKAAAATPNASPRQHIDWLALQLGGGAAFFNAGADDYDAIEVDRFVAESTILVANMSWPGFYLTAVELHPLLLLGYFGGGTRFGLRVPLKADYSHELRVGTYLGADFFMFHINAFHLVFALRPHVQYLSHHTSGSWGVGVEVPVSFHFQDRMKGGDGYSFDAPPVMVGAMAYLRWSFWRTTL